MLLSIYTPLVFTEKRMLKADVFLLSVRSLGDGRDPHLTPFKHRPRGPHSDIENGKRTPSPRSLMQRHSQQSRTILWVMVNERSKTKM